jgi:hypothetical protein
MEQTAARLASQLGGKMTCRECGRDYATDAENQRLRDEVDVLREALEQIAMSNWRDQTRAKFVARQALTRKAPQ